MFGLPVLMKFLGKVAPVLTGAAGGRGAAQDRNATQALNQAEFRLREPGTRLRTSVNASHVANATPVTSSWGGPGSGLSGQSVQFKGGYANPDILNPETKALADKITMDEIQKHLAGGEPLPKPGKTSILDHLLGIGGLAGSIAGAANAGKGGIPGMPIYKPKV